MKWLCPAKDDDGLCWNPLPCLEHNVLNVDHGAALWGNVYAEIPPTDRPGIQRLEIDGKVTWLAGTRP